MNYIFAVFLRSRTTSLLLAGIVAALYAAPVPVAKQDVLASAEKEIAIIDSLAPQYSRDIADLKKSLDATRKDSADDCKNAAAALEDLQAKVRHADSDVSAMDVQIAQMHSACDTLAHGISAAQAKRVADLTIFKGRRAALVNKSLTLKKKLPAFEKNITVAKIDIDRFAKAIDDTSLRFWKKIESINTSLTPVKEQKNLYELRREKIDVEAKITLKQPQMDKWLQMDRRKWPKKEFAALDSELTELCSRRRILTDDPTVGGWETSMNFPTDDKAIHYIDSALAVFTKQASEFDASLKKIRTDSVSACTSLVSVRKIARIRRAEADSLQALTQVEIAATEDTITGLSTDSLNIESKDGAVLQKLNTLKADIETKLTDALKKRTALSADAAALKIRIPASQVALSSAAAGSRQKIAAIQTKLVQKQTEQAALPARRDRAVTAVAAEKRRLELIAAAKEKARQDSVVTATEKKKIEEARLAKIAADQKKLEEDRQAKLAVAKEKAHQDSIAAAAALAEKKRLDEERLAKLVAEKQKLEEDRQAKLTVAKEKIHEDSLARATAIAEKQRKAAEIANAIQIHNDSIALATLALARKDSIDNARRIAQQDNLKAAKLKAVQDSIARARSIAFQDSIMAVLKKKHAAENQQTATVQAPTPAAQSADGSTQAEQDLVAIYTLIDQGKISDANKQFALKKEFLRRYCVPEAFDALRQAIEGTNKPTAAPAESADQIAVDIYNIIDKGDMGKARTLFAANRDLLKASLIKEAYDALLQTLK